MHIWLYACNLETFHLVIFDLGEINGEILERKKVPPSSIAFTVAPTPLTNFADPFKAQSQEASPLPAFDPSKI